MVGLDKPQKVKGYLLLSYEVRESDLDLLKGFVGWEREKHRCKVRFDDFRVYLQKIMGLT